MVLNTFKVGRLIDQYFGSVLGLILMILRVFLVSLRIIPLVELPRKPGRALFIKMVGFGSIVLATPTVNSLKKKFPDVKATILTLEQNRPVVELMEEFDEILTINHSQGFFLTIVNGLKALSDVRKRNFDVIFDLEIFSNLSSIFVFLSGQVFSIGFSSFKISIPYRDVFYSRTVVFDYSQHMTDIYLKMLNAIEINANEKQVTRFTLITDDFELKAKTRISQIGFEMNPIVLVNINAGELTHLRRLPLEKMEAILVGLAEKEPSVRFILIGSSEEKKFVGNFFKRLPPKLTSRTANLSGQTSIIELISLFKRGSAFLGNDSGPLHLAASVGLPCVAFFGPETPNLYGYKNPPHHMFYSNHFCSPCLHSMKYKVSNCKKNVCLEKIEEQSVINVLTDLIEK
jgi:ADP-heptose:LPS heptosyltransferase